MILAGGAINSPQLLQLSGVGPAARPGGAGDRGRGDLPGVGAHLQDHLEVYIQYRPPAGLDAAVGDPEVAPPVHRGAVAVPAPRPGATNHFEGGGFARSNDEVAYPNLMFHFLPLAIRYDGSAGAAGHGYQVHVGPMYSDARARSAQDTDPQVHPALRFNYLSTEQDRRESVEAVRVARRILNQPAMDAVQRRRDLARAGGRHRRRDPRLGGARRRDRPPPVVHRTDGRGAGSVLDPLTMRVHGVEGLRVVDASSMPYVTNGNIYAPVMMLAEKSADLILGQHPAAPEPIPFYRHGPGPSVVRRRAATGAPPGARRRPDVWTDVHAAGPSTSVAAPRSRRSTIAVTPPTNHRRSHGLGSLPHPAPRPRRPFGLDAFEPSSWAARPSRTVRATTRHARSTTPTPTVVPRHRPGGRSRRRRADRPPRREVRAAAGGPRRRPQPGGLQHRRRRDRPRPVPR